MRRLAEKQLEIPDFCPVFFPVAKGLAQDKSFLIIILDWPAYSVVSDIVGGIE